MQPTLSHSQQATYDMIFTHPVAHNLEWSSITAIFRHLGELEELPNGKIKFSRNGQTLTLHQNGKDLDVDAVFRLRHFLQASEDALAIVLGRKLDVLLVIDHSGAQIYRAGSETSGPEHVIPLDPSGHDQQVHNPIGDSGGKQGPLRKMFYEALAKKLEAADRILILGDGEGASCEMDHFVNELNENHHKELAARVVGMEKANLSHMTEHDFAARAKEFFNELALPAPTVE